MDFFDELRSLDVNVDEGLERVMGDGDLYAMMLDMFVTAIDTTPIRPEEFDGGTLDELIGKVHTLKGTTGNLSIQPLFTRYTQALGLLREGKGAQAKAVYLELLPFQEKILECIRKHQG